MDFYNNEVALFGTAPMGSKIFREISKYTSVKCFLDNDIAKQGSLYEGIPVLSPEEFASSGFDGFIIITNRNYAPVETQLRTLGFSHIIVYGANEQPCDFSLDRTLYLSHNPYLDTVQETVFRKTTPGLFMLKHMDLEYRQLTEISINTNLIPCKSTAICTGCGSCISACSKRCIKMVSNEEGFKFPEIGTGCNNCGDCIQACPVLSVQKGSITKKAYAVMADDSIRLHASSGGVFPVMATKILEQSGYVVGAAWSDNFREVQHKLISKLDDLPDLSYSKYLQSDTMNTYSETKTLLDKGHNVLYSGCPCQIAGLNCFLGQKYENLLTAELICHGVPTPLAWEKWLCWRMADKNSKIANVCMRDNSAGWRAQQLLLQLQDKTKIHEASNDAYMGSFLKDINLRKTCYNCKFKNQELERPADITIGDFWGVGDYDKTLDDDKGLSLVLVNTDKGIEFFEKLLFRFSREIPIQAARQRMLVESVEEPKGKRARFFRALNRFDYEQTVSLAEQKKAEVMLLGDYTNYVIGGQLTILAAYKIIETLGFSVKIARFSTHFNNSPKRKAIWEHLCIFSDNTVDTNNPLKMKRLNDEADCFVTCSDWTFHKAFSEGWNLFTQPFVEDDKLRIAFAASFGENGGEHEESEYGELKHRLARFTDLGIRESSGVEFCKAIGVDNAILMHDPVFCFNRSFYEELSELDEIDRPLMKTLVEGRYAVIFLKDHSENNIMLCSDIAERLGLEMLVLIMVVYQNPHITLHKFEERGIKFLADVTMCEWLYFISNSEFVLTDSFHATCFALIFNKDFVTLKHQSETPKLSRMPTLLGRAGLTERFIDTSSGLPTTDDILSIPQINWHEINNKLAEWKSEAIDFIDKALMK